MADEANRDAYDAGRDQVVVNVTTGAEQPQQPLDEDSLSRFRRLLGEDHPSTLISANNLANDLRERGAAAG
jgi:hypothetical protein